MEAQLQPKGGLTTIRETGRTMEYTLPATDESLKMIDTDEPYHWSKTLRQTAMDQWSTVFQADRPGQCSLRWVLHDVQRNATYTESESQNKPAGCRQAKLIVQDFVHPKEPVIQLLCPHFQSWSLIQKPDLQADDLPEWTWGETPGSFRSSQYGTR